MNIEKETQFQQFFQFLSVIQDPILSSSYSPSPTPPYPDPFDDWAIDLAVVVSGTVRTKSVPRFFQDTRLIRDPYRNDECLGN